MNRENRAVLLWVALILMISAIAYHEVFLKPKPEPEFMLFGYVDELRLLRDATWVFNSTDAGEALQWALDNLNGTDAVIAEKDRVYWVGVVDGS